jgi:copper chaperone CopZ
MKRTAFIVPVAIAALSFSTSAWAGGDMCHGKSEGAAKEASVGAHCSPGAKGASMASGEACKIGASNAVFSFAVPTAHCGSCVDKIQTTAMAQKGVLCAKVNLDTKTAYVAGDKKLNQRQLAKAIKAAGFDCTFKDKGPRARAELMKMMAADDEKAAAKKS